MAQVVVAVLLLLAIISGVTSQSICPEHCQSCVQNKPKECPDNRGLIPRPDCLSCCVVCAKKLGETCEEKQMPCSNDLQCKNGKCEELPEGLRPSNPPIELLSVTPVNSSSARLVVRLPPSAKSEVVVTAALESAGPWTRVPHLTNASQADGSLELILSGLEGTVHLLRVEHKELKSRAVRVELPVQDSTTVAALSCDYEGREFTVGEAYLSSDCSERCECRAEGKFSCIPTSAEAAEACHGAARKLDLLKVVDSTDDSVSLKWSGPAGVVLQSRAINTTGPWQRAERLTPDGTDAPADITLSSLQPLTTYEIRAVLPGAEEGRSSRGEDSPPMAAATTKPGPGQNDAGFCVVLGRKIATGEEIPTPNGSCSEQKCMCMPGQPPSCKPRCAVPFFKRGAFSDDPLCEEKPSPDDPCCVLLTCADNSLVTEEGGSHDPCEQCGGNAECHKSVVTSMADEALCMCKDGFIGDPYDKKEGCKRLVTAVGKDLMDKMDRCFFKNTTYSPGDHFTDGCEHLCSCTEQAEIMCKPRCTTIPDSMAPGCKLVTDLKDECCRIVMCENMQEKNKTVAGVTLAAGELFDGCKYKNKTYQRDEKFEDGCEKQCVCNNSGDVFCKPRCAPPPASTSDKCVTLRDPHDACCTVVLCDVTLGDQEVMKVNANLETEVNETKNTTKMASTTLAPKLRITIDMAEALNSSAARVIAKFPEGADWPVGAPEVAVFVAHSKDGPWMKSPGLAISKITKGELELTVAGLEHGTSHLRIEHADMRSDVVEVKLPEPAAGTACEYKGKHYLRGDEFHDGCDMYCACTKTGVQCATIECPTDFGLDVLDPHCLDWEAEPGFVATPPRCCPDMRCRDNGSCTYRGSRFDNFAEIPTKLSGCEQRCYCEFGNVSCNPACPPVPATPPSNLQCSPSEARLAHLPGEECCLYWLCPQPQIPQAGNSSNASLSSHLHTTINMTSLDSPTTLSSLPDMTNTPDVTTTEKSTEKIPIASFIPTPLPDFEEKLHKVAEDLIPDFKNMTLAEILNKSEKEFVKDKNEKSKIPNKGNEFVGPYSVNNDKDYKNKDKFPGPYAPNFEKNETIRTPFPNGDLPRPVISNRPEEEHLGPFSIPPRPPPQSPPGPFLIRGEPLPGPIPGPISENGQPPFVIGPDGRPIIQQRPNPNGPIRGGQHPNQGFNPYHEGPVPPFIPQGLPRPSGRPPQSNRQSPYGALSPIAAQIEEHLQRHPGANRFHPDEEVYHIRPHQGRPPPDAEVYNLPAEGEHFVLQDGTVVRIAPPPPQHGRQPQHPSEIPRRNQVPLDHPQRQFIEQRPRPPHHALHDDSPPHPQNRPFLPPHLADLTPEQLLGMVRSNHSTMTPTSHDDADAVSSHSLEHTASSAGPGFPNRPGMPPPFPPHQGGSDLQLKTPQLLGPREVRLAFSVPPIFVGLHGRVEVRYTDDPTKDDPTTWQRAASTADEIIESPQLVHEVSGLKPNTEYRIQVAMRLRDVGNELSSHVVVVRTPPDESAVRTTTLPPQIPIDAGLAVAEVNSTWMRVRWRKFNEYELQFIDGVQLRYKERDGKVYAATPLLYRLVDNYMLEDLRPGTEYEVGIFFIPFPGQATELQAERSVQATTAPEQADPYGFDLALTVTMVKANSVELSWTGVPYPEDKYVNIYRAIYQSDAEVGKQELSSTFKLAKRDAPARTLVQDLKPNTRYRIWLESYLTNGKIKKSDVRTFTTKPGALPSAGASEQVAEDAPRGDYYGALVGVAIVAALAVVGLAILLMVLVRRQSAASAAITPRPAKAEAAYDNPTYKTCDDPTPVATNGSSKHHTPHEEA